MKFSLVEGEQEQSTSTTSELWLWKVAKTMHFAYLLGNIFRTATPLRTCPSSLLYILRFTTL